MPTPSSLPTNETSLKDSDQGIQGIFNILVYVEQWVEPKMIINLEEKKIGIASEECLRQCQVE